MIIVVMGVLGVGKTTVGTELAHRIGATFIDADDYHSPESIRKLSAGVPLSDADRLPWLHRLHDLLNERAGRKESVVLACSALKQSYRDILSAGLPITWVYLTGPETDIRRRLEGRLSHFATATLLQSQLEILEEPTNAIWAEVSDDVKATVERVKAQLPKQ